METWKLRGLVALSSIVRARGGLLCANTDPQEIDDVTYGLRSEGVLEIPLMF